MNAYLQTALTNIHSVSLHSIKLFNNLFFVLFLLIQETVCLCSVTVLWRILLLSIKLPEGQSPSLSLSHALPFTFVHSWFCKSKTNRKSTPVMQKPQPKNEIKNKLTYFLLTQRNLVTHTHTHIHARSLDMQISWQNLLNTRQKLFKETLYIFAIWSATTWETLHVLCGCCEILSRMLLIGENGWTFPSAFLPSTASFGCIDCDLTFLGRFSFARGMRDSTIIQLNMQISLRFFVRHSILIDVQ